MLKEIEKPDWEMLCDMNLTSHARYELDRWFHRNIEPINKMIREAKEVTGWLDNPNEKLFFGEVHSSDDTHKAYLIGIEPIKKKDTSDDLLRDCLRHMKHWDKGMTKSSIQSELINRIEKLLEQEK
jgi:hypothetical protein